MFCIYCGHEIEDGSVFCPNCGGKMDLGDGQERGNMSWCLNCFSTYAVNLDSCPFCGYKNGEPPKEPCCMIPGTEIGGRYIIGEMLGIGGFGITYKAWDTKLNTVMAVKEYFPSGLVNRQPGTKEVILAAVKREQEFLYGKTRFLDEARNLAKFSTHKNIVNVYQFFEENNTVYIVMEFLEGRTLRQTQLALGGPLPYDLCLKIAADLCGALRAIHKEAILHRDISPDNVMLCENGTVKLFDFGAARFSAGMENRLTVIVKPGYAPPEQYERSNVQDARTDIYALGATMYYAMTGKKPEESTNRKIEDTLASPSEINPSIPGDVSDAIMRAMAVEPQYRFSNVDEFEQALFHTRKVLSVEKEKARRGRSRIISIAASILLILVIAFSFLFCLKKQWESAALPDAVLTIRYLETGDADADLAKEEALQKIIESFSQQYDNVEITQEALSAKEAEEAFAGEEEAIILESTGMDAGKLDAAESLEDLYENPAYPGYAIKIDRYDKQYPTGIILPAIYVNTTMGTLKDSAAFDGILSVCKETGGNCLVEEEAMEMYTVLYGSEVQDSVSNTARMDFINGGAFVLLGTTADYFDIQETLSGEYAVIIPDVGISTYIYGTTWSLICSDSSEERTAKAFLSYLHSELAQDYLHIQNRSQELPVTETALEEYLNLYGELEFVADYLEYPFKEP